MERRVVITGIGAVTPLGLNFIDTWQGLIGGRQGVGRLQRENLQDLPYVMAGEVKGFDRVSPFNEKEKRRLDLFIQYMVVSAVEAVMDAGISGFDAPVVIFGSSRGGVTGMELALSDAKKRVRPSLIISTMIGMGVSAVAEKLGISAKGYGVSSACASGAIAVGQAFRAVKSGDADVAITGGADAPITRFCMEGYGGMGLLSKRADPTASRPFSRGRDGFVLAEGGVSIVIEELGHALNRGAGIYAEIKGFDTVIAPEGGIRPSARAEAELMGILLARTGVSNEEVGFVSAHATSTPLGDRVEAEAIYKTFGSKVGVTALKGATGHMLAASGALEVATTAMALKEGVLPPIVNLLEVDGELPELRYCLVPKEGAFRYAMVNSFGLGGVFASLLLSAF